MRKFQDLLARVFDVALVLAGAALASQIRFDYLAQSGFYWALVMFSAAFALAIFPAFGVYESWRGRSKLALAGQVSLAWLIVQGCALVLMYSLHRSDLVSRLWFSYWTAMTGGLLISYRLITHAVLARARGAGMNLHQVAIVGSGSQCEAILRRIEAAPTAGFRATAVYNTRPDETSVTNSRVPVFDSVDALADYIRTNDVHELWLMLSLSEEPLICALIGRFRDDLVNIRFMPDVRSHSLFEGSGVVELLGMPAINLVASPLSASSMLKKEIFDRGVDRTRAAAAGHRDRGEALVTRAGAVQTEAQGRGRPGLHDLQVPLDASAYRSQGHAQPGDARRQARDESRRVPAPHEPRRAAAIFQRVAWRHVGRWTASPCTRA
jgi:hypothetical protein